MPDTKRDLVHQYPSSVLLLNLDMDLTLGMVTNNQQLAVLEAFLSGQ